MSTAASTAPALEARDEPGKALSLVLTIGVHVALAVFLIYGIHWQTMAPAAVEVELVRALPQPEAAPVPPPPVEEPPPPPKVEAKPPPPPPAKADISIKEKSKPVKPEARPRAAPSDPFAEELKREERRIDERRAAAAATAELARVKQAEAAQAAAQAQARASAARDKAIASYMDKIRAKIRGNLVPPPNLRGNPEATFEVVQLPSGEIISARLKRSSGSAALDDAIERAILRSSPLPKPDQGDLFSRTLELHFKPLED